MPTFEESLPIIEEEIAKRKNRWQLNSITHIDFDEVRQILLIHLNEKWRLWKQDRPLKNWLNRVISNRIANLVRDNYGNLAPPCSKCPMNQGGNLCSWTSSGEKNSECPSYSSWERCKKVGYELRLPSSIDNPNDYASFSLHSDVVEIDLEKSIERFDKELKKVLSKNNYKAYRLLFIEKASEEEVAKELGFTTSEVGRKAGYKQIYNIRKKILEESRKILAEKEIFYE